MAKVTTDLTLDASVLFDPMSHEDSHTNNTAVPVYADNMPIMFNGNDATIPGAVHSFEQWVVRTSMFKSLIHEHVVSTRGKIYVDSVDAVSFQTGKVIDTVKYSATKPCPPSTIRKEKVIENATAAHALDAKSPDPASIKFESKIPDDSAIVVNPMRVNEEKSALLVALTHVFGKADWAEELIEEVAGDGLRFLEKVHERGTNASIKDKTAVSVRFEEIRRRGVSGEVTLDSFTAFLKTYRLEKRSVAVTISDESEAEMISAIAFKDPSLRDIYEVKSTLAEPKNLAEASEIVKGILRSRLRSSEMDDPSGQPPAGGMALAAAGGNGPPPGGGGGGICPPCGTPSSPELAALMSMVTALADKVATFDPTKNQRPGGPTGGGVRVPRNKDGSVKKWIEGMDKCRYCGGKHLHRECNSKAAKDAAEAAKKAKEGSE